MATENGNGVAAPGSAPATNAAADPKGKGKAVAPEDVPQDTEMDEDDDDDDEEDEADDNAEEAEDAEDEDGMEEINLDNVIGRRTRGRVIDFAKAAEEQNISIDDEDEDEDDDFEDPDGKMDED